MLSQLALQQGFFFVLTTDHYVKKGWFQQTGQVNSEGIVCFPYKKNYQPHGSEKYGTRPFLLKKIGVFFAGKKNGVYNNFTDKLQ